MAECGHMLTMRHGFAHEHAESADGSTALRQVRELSASSSLEPSFVTSRSPGEPGTEETDRMPRKQNA